MMDGDSRGDGCGFTKEAAVDLEAGDEAAVLCR